MDTKHRKLLRIACLFAALMLALTIARAFMLAGQQAGHRSVDRPDDANIVLITLNDNWTLHHEDGSTEAVTLPYEFSSDEDSVTMTRSVSKVFSSGHIIKFDNYRQGITVKADGRELYSVNTTSLVKQIRFTDFQLVDLPEAESINDLCLRVYPAKDGEFILPEVSYGSYEAAMNEIVCHEVITLLIVIVLSLFFLMTVATIIVSLIGGSSYQLVLDISLFLLLTILWGVTDSYLPILTHIPQEVIGLVNYYSIMALPLPICHYVMSIINKKNKLLLSIFIVGLINLIMQSLLSCFGIIHLQDTFFTAHLLIIIVIIASLEGIYYMRKENKEAGDIKILYVALIMLAAFALLSLLIYWRVGGLHYRNCMLVGILLFTLTQCAYIVAHYIRVLQEDRIKISESRIHEQMAMFDTLTGLPNRRSFEKKIEEIEADSAATKDVVLVMLDLNGLKRVNDQYGHSAGDDLIVSAANVIRVTYGLYGTCYRIGGDEFVAILEAPPISMFSLDDQLEKNIAKRNANSQWALSIAKGESHLIAPDGSRLSISDWKQEADVNMYRDKVSMSGSRSLERSQNLRDIISCIVSTVEAKDKYTAVHSERVCEISCCIAQKLGVSELTMQNLSVAAQLHDIGKIGVPDNILLKNGRLTAEEYEKIKLHSQIGANIISRDQGMKEVAEIVLHHHERWDGKGYPDGLSHKDIPMESRIIAVADSIDAMTSKRVYRDSMSLEKCRHEIEANSGIMYDPAIVQIVLQNWDEIVDIILIHPKHLV